MVMLSASPVALPSFVTGIDHLEHCALIAVGELFDPL